MNFKTYWPRPVPPRQRRMLTRYSKSTIAELRVNTVRAPDSTRQLEEGAMAKTLGAAVVRRHGCSHRLRMHGIERPAGSTAGCSANPCLMSGSHRRKTHEARVSLTLMRHGMMRAN